MTKIVRKNIAMTIPEDSFMVELTADTMFNGLALSQLFGGVPEGFSDAIGTLAARVAPLKSYPKAKWIAFTPKGEKVLQITQKSNYKPSKTHTKVFGIVLFVLV